MNHLLKCHDMVKTNFVRGENCRQYDDTGRSYIDFESGIWAAALGHCHPRINQVMHEQIDQIMHLGTRYPNATAEEAATLLLDQLGFGDGKCVFLSSGSEAVEFGVQAVRRITGRPLLLAFDNAYLAAYGSAGKKAADDWCLLNWNAATPESLDGIPFDQIGGFIFEPGGSGSSFVRFPPQALVQQLAQRVRQAGGLLMANEITTGMGRTGKWFGHQHYAFEPDIVALGKGLGNGYPVSAVVMKSAAAEKLEASGLRYAQSHQNDPLGCRVAAEVISVLRAENWVERGAETGAFFLQGLQQAAARHPLLIKEARGRGMLLALELQPHEQCSAAWLYGALLEKGFLVGYYPAGNVVRFDPSLTMERGDVAALLESLDAVLTAVEKGQAV